MPAARFSPSGPKEASPSSSSAAAAAAAATAAAVAPAAAAAAARLRGCRHSATALAFSGGDLPGRSCDRGSPASKWSALSTATLKSPATTVVWRGGGGGDGGERVVVAVVVVIVAAAAGDGDNDGDDDDGDSPRCATATPSTIASGGVALGAAAAVALLHQRAPRRASLAANLASAGSHCCTRYLVCVCACRCCKEIGKRLWK
jgi:hypothetical protein